MGVLVNPYWHLTGSNTAIGAQLGDEPAGLALDFLALLALVRGHTTNFLGDPNALLTYASPSAKLITNGLGLLESGTTLRCDHDPATLDSSTSSLTSLGVGTGIPIQMSVVTTGAVTYVAGQVVRITDAADVTKWMVGTVVSWTAGTSTLVVNVYASTGYISGSSWKVIVSLGLLVEEQRTNLFQQSDNFVSGTWGKDSGITVTSNAATGPNGAVSADRISSDGTGTGRVFQISTGLPASTSHVISFILKMETARYVNIATGGTRFTGNSNHDRLNIFDLQTGTITNNPGNNTLSIDNLGGGWFSCNVGVTTDADAGTDQGSPYIKLTSSPTSLVAVSGSVLAWVGQFEAGAFRSSPIITAGSQVTRAADNISLLVSAFSFTGVADTFVFEYIRRHAGGANWIAVELAAATRGNALFQITENGTGTINHSVRAASFALVANATKTFAINTVFRSATRLKQDDFAFSLDGAAVTTDASGTWPASPMSKLQIGAASGSSAHMNGHVRKLALVARGQTNTELPMKSAA